MDIKKTLSGINALGYSDGFIAKSIGVSSMTVFRYRSGATTPLLDTANKIEKLAAMAADFHKQAKALANQ